MKVVCSDVNKMVAMIVRYAGNRNLANGLRVTYTPPSAVNVSHSDFTIVVAVILGVNKDLRYNTWIKTKGFVNYEEFDKIGNLANDIIRALENENYFTIEEL